MEVKWDREQHEEHVNPLTNHENDFGLGILGRVFFTLFQNSQLETDIHGDDVHGISGTLKTDNRDLFIRSIDSSPR